MRNKFNTIWFIAFFSVLIVWTVLPAFAGGQTSIAPDIAPSAINVKDFGAVGDGVHDDTAAIQKAVNAFVAQYQPHHIWIKAFHGAKHGVAYNAQSVIVFPPGTYRITRPIVFHTRYANVRGIGNATIVQSNLSKMAFYFDGTWKARIRHLNFKGGSTPLRFWTGNKNTSMLFVENCTFAHSSSYAIVCRSHTEAYKNVKRIAHSKPWAPYQVKWEKGQPTVTPSVIPPKQTLKSWNNSTLLAVVNCRFNHVARAVSSNCDGFVMRNCQLTVNPTAGGPVFEFPLSGENHLYHVKATATLNPPTPPNWPIPDTQPYWIECGGILSVRHSSFQTTGKKGMNLVRVSPGPVYKVRGISTWGWSCIVLNHVKLQCAGGRDNTILWFRKNWQPNIVSLVHVTDTTGQPVRAMAWADGDNLKNLHHFQNSNGSPLKNLYKITFSHVSSNINTTLPKALQPYRTKNIPQTILKQTFVAPLKWSVNDIKKKSQHILYASKLGLADNGKGDDTKAIQKVIDIAAKKGFSTVILPGRIYQLSDVIHLPANIILRVAGVAVFKQTNPDKDIFTGVNAENIVFDGLVLEGGKDGIHITTQNKTPARIAFIDGQLNDQYKAGIRCSAGSGKIGEKNHTQLLIGRSVLATMHGLVTNASRSQLMSVWCSNDPHLHYSAFFKNLGGAMRIDMALCVPRLYVGKPIKGKLPAEYQRSGQAGTQTRWIDNYGQLYALDCRFSGEFKGGMCNIFQHRAGGTVYVSGGLARFYNPHTRKCLLYLQQPVKAAVLRHISTPPGSVRGSKLVMAPTKKWIKRVFVQGVMAP